MLRSLKVATPATAATVVVPEREPPPGLCSIATVTLPVNVSTAFPSASRATTGTAGVMVAPAVGHGALGSPGIRCGVKVTRDRKSTRLNSSHGYISYAVFCLKKKKITNTTAVNTNNLHAVP